MAAYNGTTMEGQDFEAENNSTMPIVPTVLKETWENATLYYSIPNPDPSLNDCKPTILQSEIEVSIGHIGIVPSPRSRSSPRSISP